ncbi:AIM24 family protein [Deinococcus cellulosilyticus]|uniref:Ser/Arg-related nuclear matrix protein n=1 Tax=Deinococcus cellulosilyticus (strain DSM 18568 / NBRC 106333 / KACC 11606 / 5516J-15) TaxID=1223518 RepID=A0A511N6V1_DEIC1|nr:AIM24 family protein [Deinococcus cellulosilyticus]GEM48198.1 hypothetical protein DC3_38330 [Deinococcus cellulosilyticus NBRC 106333 = KACC 11606]
MTILNVNTLPVNDNINPYAFSVDVVKDYIVRKGKMIAYYGNLRFEALGSNIIDMIVANSFNAPAYGGDYIVVTGRGKLVVGDNGNHINSYDLENANMTIKAANLLAYEPTLTCEECVTPGYVTLLGTGKMLASSNGMVHFMEPPVRVDPDALLGWADCPTPSFHHDYAYVRNALSLGASMMGLSTSGEEKQINFTGQGTVIIQSSEVGLKGSGLLQEILNDMNHLQHTEMLTLKSILEQRLNQNR